MRRLFRVLLWGLGGLTVFLLLLIAAWVASNGRWADTAPQPAPSELRLTAVQLAPSRNAFYDLQGLNSPPAADANASGRASLQWQDEPHEAAALSWPKDPLWHCKPAESSCVQAWREQRARMAELLTTVQDMGRRCESMAKAEGIEEVLPERPTSGPLANTPFIALPLPRFAGISNCLRWFGVRAVLAATPREAQAELEKGNRLARLVLAGSRSLIGTMIGVAGLQNHWLLSADWAATTQGVDRTHLSLLLAALPERALSPRTWVPYESRFVRELMRDLVDGRGCGSGDDLEILSGHQLWCRVKWGLLPERSIQYNDARWLARLATLPAQGLASCEQLSLPVWRETHQAWPVWRNTLGRLMLDSPGTDGAHYTSRQLDLELLRQTLRAQALGEPVPSVVQLTRDNGAQRFAACRARLFPGQLAATLRLPLF